MTDLHKMTTEKKTKPKTTPMANDNGFNFKPDHEYARQWALDTLSGKAEGGHFSTGERNLARAYLELLKQRKASNDTNDGQFQLYLCRLRPA